MAGSKSIQYLPLFQNISRNKDMISLNPQSQDNSQHYEGREIIDAGGADGEG